jgi:type I restriction enzyme S subunit
MSNSIPGSWKKSVFSDVVKLDYGKSPKDIFHDQGLYPVIGTGGITGFTNSFLHEGQTTVIGRKGTINKPSFIESSFWAIDTTYFVAEHKNAHPKWFYYLVQDIDLTKYNEASGVPSLNRDTLYSIPHLLPPLPEQQKIAAILTSVDDVIESIQAQINKLKDLKTGMMQELLTKGVERDGLPHTEFKDSAVGRVPKGW